MRRLKELRFVRWLYKAVLYFLAFCGALFVIMLTVFFVTGPHKTTDSIAATVATPAKKGIVLVPTYTPSPSIAHAPSTSTVAPASVPKPTNTPEPTVAPTATPMSGVTVDSANLRAGPGTTYPISGSLASGQNVNIVAKNDAGDWYQLDSKTWIAAFLVNIGGVVADQPTPTTGPKVLTYSEVRAIADAATDVQWDVYSASLKGKFVINWTGWVDDVSEKMFVGGYQMLIDMDSPSELFSLYDVTFDISNSQALKFSKNSQIIFSGKIKRAYKMLGTLTIELTDVGVVPSQ